MKRINSSAKHRGFTLLELLIVVAIIALLAALTIAVMTGITDQAREEATKTTIIKIQTILEQRIQAFDRAYRGAREDAAIRATVRLLADNSNGRFDRFLSQVAGEPQEAPPQIRALAKKASFRFEFPQSRRDLNASTGAADDDLPSQLLVNVLGPRAVTSLEADGHNQSDSGFQSLLNDRVDEMWQQHLDHEELVANSTGGTASVGSNASFHSTESSEFLHFIIFHGSAFGIPGASADEFRESEIADTDGDGLPEFVDGWGNPLRFYRWPTRLIDPTAPSPFDPVFETQNDPTEVDLTPSDDSDGNLRRVTLWERELAEVVMKGLPPAPTPLGSSTPRDLLLTDPDDPVGFLYTFLEDPALKAMGVRIFDEFNEENYHTPDTYHAPLIISAGPDEMLGLREPNDISGGDGIFGNLAQYAGTTVDNPDPNAVSGVVDSLFDNVSNRNRRAGGRR